MPGFSGDGGHAAQARLGYVYGVAVDGEGNLYIADSTNHRIRKVDSTGTITTIAGTGGHGFGGDGGLAAAAQFDRPYGVVVDEAGNLYIADSTNHRIRKVDSTGTITTIAGTGESGFDGDGGPAAAAQLSAPTGVAVDGAGNLYIADTENQRIRKVDSTGPITTIAGTGERGDGGPAAEAQLSDPIGVAVDGAGNLYIAERDNQRIRKVDSTGTITTIAGTGELSFGGDSGPATEAQLSAPTGVAVDGAGNVYIADTENQRIRKVDSTGTITTIAGTGELSFGGDGGPASEAQLAYPTGVAVDEAGNVYIADLNNHRIRKVDSTGTITTIAGTGGYGFSEDGGPASEAQLPNPRGVAVDGAGNVYVAESGSSRIFKVDSTGTITTIAGTGEGGFGGGGGPATEEPLANPRGVAVDGAGNVYVADRGSSRIFKVDSTGTITTIAGTGEGGFGGDGGPAVEAQLSAPTGVAVDGAGNVYIADRNNQRIRMLTPTAEGVTGIAPSDQAAFDNLVVGQRMLSSLAPAAGLYHVDFVEAGRFEEHRFGATNQGSYTYSNRGRNTGTVVFTYDAGNICTYNVSFISRTTGTLSYTCTEGQPGELDWRLVADPDYMSVTPPGTGTVEPEPFSIPNLGGWSTMSNGTEANPRAGYGRIRAEAGSTTPSGIAIFGFGQGGVLIAEAGVPASEPVQEGRIFAESSGTPGQAGSIQTGLAIANPNDTPATILFYFRDAEGERFGDGQFELGAHEQTAKFLDQEPFNSGNELSGTFTFTSSQPIAVIALRGLTNRDREFLMTTLPVAPLASTSTDTVYFPHFTDGDGWVTQVILVNPTDRTIAGNIQFVDQGSATADAAPAILTLDDGRTGSEFPYSIPAGGSQRFTTSNPSGTPTTGSVRAIPDTGSVAPSGLVVFSFTSNGKTVSESGVPALPAGSAFRVYAESSGTPEEAGSIRTGLAITNTADTATTLTLEVTDLDGNLAMGVAQVTLTLPPSGQVARFLDEIFDSLPGDFSGVLRVTSTADVAIVGLRLRINDRKEHKITITPPSIETDPPTMADKFFPHIVDSGGWSTQFILFSGTAGQTSSGTLSFFDTEGEPWDLPTSVPE